MHLFAQRYCPWHMHSAWLVASGLSVPVETPPRALSGGTCVDISKSPAPEWAFHLWWQSPGRPFLWGQLTWLSWPYSVSGDTVARERGSSSEPRLSRFKPIDRWLLGAWVWWFLPNVPIPKEAEVSLLPAGWGLGARSPFRFPVSLLRGEVSRWPSQEGLALHSCLPSLCPVASGDHGGRAGAFLQSCHEWGGQCLLATVPVLASLGVGTHELEMGWPTVLACLGLFQLFALKFCVPGNPPVPGKLGQLVTLGRKTISCAFTVLCPHLVMLSFCYNFFKWHHFVSTICFFPGPWLIHQELQDKIIFRVSFRVYSNQMGRDAKHGKQINLLHLNSFLKICPLERHVMMTTMTMMVAVTL